MKAVQDLLFKELDENGNLLRAFDLPALNIQVSGIKIIKIIIIITMIIIMTQCSRVI